MSRESRPNRSRRTNELQQARPAATRWSLAAELSVMRTRPGGDVTKPWVLGLLLLTGCRSHPPMYSARTLGELRQLNEALGKYSAACGGFPGDLSKLSGAPSQPSTCGAMGLLPPDLLTSPRSGYEWSYWVSEPLPGRPPLFKKYELRATWRGAERASERRSFWTNETREIRAAEGRPAGPEDPALR
jgi:hypothetical protein